MWSRCPCCRWDIRDRSIKRMKAQQANRHGTSASSPPTNGDRAPLDHAPTRPSTRVPCGGVWPPHTHERRTACVIDATTRLEGSRPPDPPTTTPVLSANDRTHTEGAYRGGGGEASGGGGGLDMPSLPLPPSCGGGAGRCAVRVASVRDSCQRRPAASASCALVVAFGAACLLRWDGLCGGERRMACVVSVSVRIMSSTAPC